MLGMSKIDIVKRVKKAQGVQKMEENPKSGPKSTPSKPQRYKTFNEFYPFYLSEHKNSTNRLLHFIGSFSALIQFSLALSLLEPIFILTAILSGYAFAWVGHFIVEKNRPATFTYPLYSLMGDWKMFFELLLRRRKFSEFES